MIDNQQIVLPQELLEQFKSMSYEDFAALERAGELFVHRILWPQGLLRKPLLQPHEESNAQAILEIFLPNVPNMVLEASTRYALMRCAQAGLADMSSMDNIERFFNDAKEGKVI